MTKLVYIVGNKKIDSYKEAIKESERTGFQIITKYFPIREKSKLSKKKQEYFSKIRKERRAEK